MSEQAAPLTNVTTNNFRRVVLGAPPAVTVVLDFWASWCPHCATFGPILERVVSSLGPGYVLTKADVDAEPELAEQLGVETVPTVMVFRSGALVGGFVGAIDEEEELRLQLVAAMPAHGEDLVSQGDEMLRVGNTVGAEAAFRAAVEVEPGNDAARVSLAQLLCTRGAERDAEELLAGVGAESEQRVFARALLGELRLKRFCGAAGNAAAAAQRVDLNGSDIDARFSVASCAAAAGRYRQALEELLRIVEADRHFRDGAAGEAMRAIFAIIGEESTLADEFRARLEAALH